MKSLFKKKKNEKKWEFPGGPVVTIQCFHCHGLGSFPGSNLLLERSLPYITVNHWQTQTKPKTPDAKSSDLLWLSEFCLQLGLDHRYIYFSLPPIIWGKRVGMMRTLGSR